MRLSTRYTSHPPSSTPQYIIHVVPMCQANHHHVQIQAASDDSRPPANAGSGKEGGRVSERGLIKYFACTAAQHICAACCGLCAYAVVSKGANKMICVLNRRSYEYSRHLCDIFLFPHLSFASMIIVLDNV